ncbi:hypothetical protein GCM10009119_10600 [Algoriphagus jejuensis]|uniref:Uncharacterized protein n=2 Tax=Algoriphagus jejuensis TaxID=419934 RepID=A0ABP3YAR7_9BACT
MGDAMMSSIGFSSAHLDCGMEMEMAHEENGPDFEKDPNSCCKNTSERLSVDDDFQLKKQQISLDLQFAVALVQVFFYPLVLSDTEEPKFTHYITPPLHRDYPVLFESFLI